MRDLLSGKRFAAAALTVALLLAGLVSLVASRSPDGLERVAEDTGFLGTATEHGASGSPLADYDVAFLGGGFGRSAAGVVGVLLVLVLFYGLARVLARRPTSTSSPTSGHEPGREDRP